MVFNRLESASCDDFIKMGSILNVSEKSKHFKNNLTFAAADLLWLQTEASLEIQEKWL